MNTFKWRVWFTNRQEPVLVETQIKLPVHAVGAAIDQVKMPTNSGMNVRRIELLDAGGGLEQAWDWKPSPVSRQFPVNK